jgi:hypothetical protein
MISIGSELAPFLVSCWRQKKITTGLPLVFLIFQLKYDMGCMKPIIKQHPCRLKGLLYEIEAGSK